jgi:hypothetical protein
MVRDAVESRIGDYKWLGALSRVCAVDRVKAHINACALRGAEAPLFHGAIHISYYSVAHTFYFYQFIS